MKESLSSRDRTLLRYLADTPGGSVCMGANAMGVALSLSYMAVRLGLDFLASHGLVVIARVGRSGSKANTYAITDAGRAALVAPAQAATKPRATARATRPAFGRGWVYLLREEGEGGRIKIGHTRERPHRRLEGLQTGNSRVLRLVAAIPFSDAALERWLHDRFARDRVEGEWFTASPGLLQFIEGAAVAGRAWLHVAVSSEDERSRYVGQILQRSGS